MRAILCRALHCFYHFRQLRVIYRSHSSSSSSSTVPLVYAFIINGVDYCSSFYCGLPKLLLQSLHGVLNVSARFAARQRIHYKELLHYLALYSWHCAYSPPEALNPSFPFSEIVSHPGHSVSEYSLGDAFWKISRKGESVSQ